MAQGVRGRIDDHVFTLAAIEHDAFDECQMPKEVGRMR
jgi:hypothetical protein